MVVAQSKSIRSVAVTVVPFPLREITTELPTEDLAAIVASAQDAHRDLSHVENQLLALNPSEVAPYLLQVLGDAQRTQAEIQVATMTLLRMGNRVREDVLRFAMHAQAPRAIWIADFLVHQLGLKKVS
ncbi:MAG: hypothetical protein HEQ32_00340 [Vampirovibrio sp.]